MASLIGTWGSPVHLGWLQGTPKTNLSLPSQTWGWKRSSLCLWLLHACWTELRSSILCANARARHCISPGPPHSGRFPVEIKSHRVTLPVLIAGKYVGQCFYNAWTVLCDFHSVACPLSYFHSSPYLAITKQSGISLCDAGHSSIC